jgi:predicted amidohydrolase
VYEKPRVDASFVAVAEPLDGPTASKLAAIARENALFLVAGFIEESGHAGLAYNTILVFDPEGQRRAVYRKIHLFDSQELRESDYIKPAPDLQPVIFDADGVSFGVLTCYDLRFPNLAASLSEAGAKVLLTPSSWVPGPHKVDQWNVLTRARALDNGCFVVAVSQAEPVSIGHSLAVGPLGSVLVQCGAGVQALAAELEMEAVERARRVFPLRSQRRI